MKNLLAPLFSALLTLTLASCFSQAAEPQPLYYLNPMDPSIRSDVPAKDNMGMEYIPVYAEDLEEVEGEGYEEDEDDENEGPSGFSQVSLTQKQQRFIELETAPVVKGAWNSQVNTVGKVTYNEKAWVHVSARISGRVEELNANFTGLRVNQGDTLYSLYSPELVAAQQELIQLYPRRNEGPTQGIFERTRQKLLLWGLTASQIQRLLNSGVPWTSMPILAPVSGTIISKNITSGMYIEEGQMLFEIADLTRLWVVAEVFEPDARKITLQSQMETPHPTEPGQKVTLGVSFIAPVLNPESRTIQVRGEWPQGQAAFPPNSYVNLRVTTPGGEPALSIPQSAVLDTGSRKIVYRRLGRGQFEGVAIETGDRWDSRVIVLKGLEEGDEVVAQGLFLLDSQAQLTDLNYDQGPQNE